MSGIFKVSQLAVGGQQQVTPHQDQGFTMGLDGPQRKWWVKLGDQSATVYAGYQKDHVTPGPFAVALKTAGPGGAVLVQKYVEGSKVKYSYRVWDGSQWVVPVNPGPDPEADAFYKANATAAAAGAPALPGAPAPASTPTATPTGGTYPAGLGGGALPGAPAPAGAPAPQPQPTSPPPSSAPAPTGRHGAAKENSIVLQACLKTIGSAFNGHGLSPAEIFGRAEWLLRLHNSYIDSEGWKAAVPPVIEDPKVPEPDGSEEAGF